jgi:methionine-rich copper-binding protein CopC
MKSSATLLIILTVLVWSFVVSGATSASAHSFPEVETPAAGQTLTASPSEITIKYDAPIEKLFAKIEVLGSDGQNVAQSGPVVGNDGYTLSVKVPPLKPGDYLVKWGVVCVDTHHTQGSYTFTVASSGR